MCKCSWAIEPLAPQLFGYTQHQRQCWRDARTLSLRGFEGFQYVCRSTEMTIDDAEVDCYIKPEKKFKKVKLWKTGNLCKLAHSDWGLTLSIQLPEASCSRQHCIVFCNSCLLCAMKIYLISSQLAWVLAWAVSVNVLIAIDPKAAIIVFIFLNMLITRCCFVPSTHH